MFAQISEKRGGAPKPLEAALRIDGAASEARYDAVFSTPGTPIPHPLSTLQESLHKIPAPVGRGATSSSSATRRSICETCEHKKGFFCDVCGCIIALKARVPFAHCPLGKW